MNLFKKGKTDYDLLCDMLNSIGTSLGEDDETFRNVVTRQIADRDKSYTELLKHFVRLTKTRNIVKEICKWTICLITIIAIIFLIWFTSLLFNRILNNKEATIESLIEYIPLLITSIVGFVSTIIVIPLTIIKYLFSTKEDENITNIILHTQEHDTTGRQWAMDYKKRKDDAINNMNYDFGDENEPHKEKDATN